MYDFFISHSSIDKPQIVNELVGKLHNMGYSVWYDNENILIGDNIPDSIKKGLADSYCLILIITNNFFKSRWTFYEVGLFDSSRIKRIIPLLYNITSKNKNKLQSMLGNIKYLDVDKTTKEDIVVRLIQLLDQVKKDNIDLQVIDNIRGFQKRLATYETINSGIISIKLNEYLNLVDNNNELLVLSAKKIVKTVIEDLLKNYQEKNELLSNNNDYILAVNKYNIGSKNFREYVEYVINQDCESTNYECFTIINRAIANILSYYINQNYNDYFSSSQIEVALPKDLKYGDFVDMYEIDKKVMRKDLIASVETTYSWFVHNNYTHIGVRNKISQKIIGYFSVLPITDDTYQKIISGNFEDKDFTTDCIEQYIFSDFYKIYIAGVGIDPLFQNTGAFIILYNSLIDLIISMAKEREIYISEILAEASTKQGEKFCKMVGMTKIASSKNNTDVYRLITIPPEFRLRNNKGKELYDICNKKFSEYRDYFEKI